MRSAMRALVWCALLAGAGHAWADEPEAVFARANAAYEDGDYDAAIETYGQLVAMGAEDRDLYYNLGNAYFKSGRLGYAVLYYERARQLAPRDEDIRSNLALTRSLLADRQFVNSPGLIRRAIMWPHDNLSARESFVFASIAYALLTLAVIAFVFRGTRLVGGIYSRLSVLSPGRLFGLEMTQDMILGISVLAFILCLSGGSAVWKYRQESARDVGVIVEPEIAVYSGPSSDATLQYRIHEGTRVMVESNRAGWLEIELPGELSGWIRADAVERI